MAARDMAATGPRPVYIRPRDARSVIGIHRTTLYRWIKAGLVDAHKQGRATFVRLEDIEKVIEGKAA